MPQITSANPELDRGTYLTCFRLVLERCDPNVRPEQFGQTILHEVAAMGEHVTAEEGVEFTSESRSLRRKEFHSRVSLR